MSKRPTIQTERKLDSAHPSLPYEDADKIERFCDSLKTLSSPHRLRIMMSLQDGEASVGDLEQGLKIKQPNLSHELRKLRDKGMVKTRRQSKVVFYSIAHPDTASLIKDISLLFSNQQTSGYGRENDDTPLSAKSFSEREAHGECGQFPLVQHS